MTAKTYTIARCANGCAYHSTVGGNCGMCDGPLGSPVTVDRAGALAIMSGGAEYDRGKAAVIAWLKARR